MANVRNVITRMAEIAKHTKIGLDDYGVTAEHDIIRMRSPWETWEAVPADIAHALSCLNWHWDTECDMWAVHV